MTRADAPPAEAALPRFVGAGRRRPVDLVVPGSSLTEVLAPYAAVTGPGPALGDHPALATGPALDDLSLAGAATDLTQAEGTTLAHLDGAWRVLASDKESRRYPVFDLRMRETGALRAPYPTNIPWPTVVSVDDDTWLLVGFNGRPLGGPVAGYGTHGDVVFSRTIPPPG